jgi:membrane protein DedA with SNARE-associated domain/rhodanese-related sulfurtransferase
MHNLPLVIQDFCLLIVWSSVLVNAGGLPLPAYPVLMIAGALSAAHGPSLAKVLFAAVTAALIADLGWYLAGVRVGRRLLAFFCKISVAPDSCVRQSESRFTRIGPLTLLFAKFVPGLGTIAIVLSGVIGISLPLFLSLDAVGVAIYFGLPVVLGYIFRDAIETFLLAFARLGQYGLLLLVLGVAVYVLARWIQRQRFIRKLRMDRISVNELTTMIEKGDMPIIFDVRGADARLRDGIIPGSIAARESELSTILASYTTDVEVVIYCSCPNEASAATAARHLQRAGFTRIRPLLGGIEAWTQAGHAIAIPPAGLVSTQV